jgi:DNA processing protein
MTTSINDPFLLKQISEDDYPETLRNAKGKPKSLYMRGSLPPAHYRYLCVIGSRHPSSYGIEVVNGLIAGLSGYPICIVSGLAIGIDGQAHRAALSSKLPTISFPGSGLDWNVLYPQSNRGLAKRILEAGGGLFSKFQPDWEMNDFNKWSFPVRNEIMAGISHAVLVIEARLGSGTLSTVNAALKTDCKVMVVPGSIFSELSATPIKLLSEGAIPVTSSEDILEELRLILPRKKDEENDKNDGDNSNSNGGDKSDSSSPTLFGSSSAPRIDEALFTPEELKIIDRIRSPLSRDDLIRELALPPGYVNAVLVQLELKGVITERQGQLMVV